MANAWIEHVRRWSKANNETYMCAVTKPECRASYKTGRPLKAPRGPAKAKPALPASPAPVVRVGKTVRVKMPKPAPVNERSQPLTAGLSSRDMDFESTMARARQALGGKSKKSKSGSALMENID
jgi:hypothetical protein